MLKFKFSISIIFGLLLILGGCTKYERPVRGKRLVVLKENLDTVCVVEYYDELILQTKKPVRRKSVSIYNDSWKQTTIVIEKDEKPIFKTLGGKQL